MTPDDGEERSLAHGLGAEKFWQFSLTLYGVPAVKHTCLVLQDDFGADVNLILLMCWLDAQRLTIGDDCLKTLIAVAGDHQTNLIGPVRKERRKAKGTHAYDKLLARELELERDEQKALVGEVCSRASAQQEQVVPTCLERYGNHAALPDQMLNKIAAHSKKPVGQPSNTFS